MKTKEEHVTEVYNLSRLSEQYIQATNVIQQARRAALKEATEAGVRPITLIKTLGVSNSRFFQLRAQAMEEGFTSEDPTEVVEAFLSDPKQAIEDYTDLSEFTGEVVQPSWDSM